MGYLPKVLSYKKRRKSTNLAYVLILITYRKNTYSSKGILAVRMFP